MGRARPVTESPRIMTDRTWEHARYCDAVAAEIDHFADVVRDADVAAPIGTCPDWTLADLLRHVGTVHRWAGAMVRDLAQQRYGRHELDLDLPERPEDYPDWLAAGARQLVPVLRAADPDAPMWSWGADRHARFWSRRMLHETTVHRADAELTLGRDPEISPDVAADGIEEFFDNLPGAAASFAPHLQKLRGAGETIGLAADAGDGEGDAAWLISLDPDGVTLRPGNGTAALVVRGSLADLMLFVWGRRKPGDAHLEISGDTVLLAHWVEHSAI